MIDILMYLCVILLKIAKFQPIVAKNTNKIHQLSHKYTYVNNNMKNRTVLHKTHD